MSLIDELRAAAEEYATEATITQEAWSAALVEGWLKCCSIGWALTKAANIQGIGIAPHVWDRLLEQTEQLTPRLSRYTNLKGDLRPWIANNAVHAKRRSLGRPNRGCGAANAQRRGPQRRAKVESSGGACGNQGRSALRPSGRRTKFRQKA